MAQSSSRAARRRTIALQAKAGLVQPRRGARRGAALAAGGLLLVMLVAGVLFLGLHGALRRSAEADAIGGPFALRDMNGRPVTAHSFGGRVLLLYFGYTQCPDICPTTLATVTAALDRLGDAAVRIQPLFITVDPAHDSGAVTRRYLAAFSPRLIGLTGSTAAIADVERRYHVETSAGPGGIAHSAALYVLGPEGGLLRLLSPQETPERLAAALRDALQDTRPRG